MSWLENGGFKKMKTNDVVGFVSAKEIIDNLELARLGKKSIDLDKLFLSKEDYEERIRILNEKIKEYKEMTNKEYHKHFYEIKNNSKWTSSQLNNFYQETVTKLLDIIDEVIKID